MDELTQMQNQLNEWRVANFGKPNAHHQLMGIVEEVGELSHALLKWEQGIRGYDEAKAKEEMRDSIGDIIIFAMGLCDVYGWNMNEIASQTTAHVLKRDWKANATTGQK